jgi:hypothetical protein
VCGQYIPVVRAALSFFSISAIERVDRQKAAQRRRGAAQPPAPGYLLLP